MHLVSPISINTKPLPRGSSFSTSSTTSNVDIQQQGFDFNDGYSTTGDVICISTTTQFFNDTSLALEKDKEGRVSRTAALKNRRSRSSKNSSPLLAIDEDKEIDSEEYLKEKRVKITTLIIPHDGKGCADFVSTHLNQAVSEHPSFISLAKLPEVFRDVFVSVDKAFMDHCEKSGNENDESGCSVICVVITSNNGTTVAHVGDVRGVIRGADGAVAELIAPHLVEESFKEMSRLKKAHAPITSTDSRLFGKLPYSRSFGHKSLKRQYPGCLISLPNVIQLQMNMASEPTPLVRTTSVPSLFGHGKNNNSTRSIGKVNRNDILLIVGSCSSWERCTDRRMCASFVSSVVKGDAINDTADKMINIKKQSSNLFWKDKESINPQNTSKGLYVVNWTSFSY